MKRMKRIVVLGVAMVLCANIAATTSLAKEAATTPAQSSESQVYSPMVEETEWVYRIYNGVYQKRLWSLTYGKWLTDWIDCVV